MTRKLVYLLAFIMLAEWSPPVLQGMFQSEAVGERRCSQRGVCHIEWECFNGHACTQMVYRMIVPGVFLCYKKCTRTQYGICLGTSERRGCRHRCQGVRCGGSSCSCRTGLCYC